MKTKVIGIMFASIWGRVRKTRERDWKRKAQLRGRQDKGLSRLVSWVVVHHSKDKA